MTTKKISTSVIKSRYGDPRYITNRGGGCYTIEGLAHYTRQSTDDKGNLTMLDFDGGPCLFVGGKFSFDLSNTDVVIESIIVDDCTPVQKKYISTIDNKEKTTTVYNVKISVTVG